MKNEMTRITRPKKGATKEHISEQNINLLVMDGLLHAIKEKSDDPDTNLVDYLKTLPAPLLSLVSQYIPKKKDTNEGLVASHISLIKSYEHLPDVNDLATRCHVLKSELVAAHMEIKRLSYFMEHIVYRNPPKGKARSKLARPMTDERRMYHLLKKVQSDAHAFKDRATQMMITPASWLNELTKCFGEEYLKELREKRFGADYEETLPQSADQTISDQETADLPSFKVDGRTRTRTHTRVKVKDNPNPGPGPEKLEEAPSDTLPEAPTPALDSYKSVEPGWG